MATFFYSGGNGGTPPTVNQKPVADLVLVNRIRDLSMQRFSLMDREAMTRMETSRNGSGFSVTTPVEPE